MELSELQNMTVVKLREEAMKHSGLSGVSAMSKNELIVALAPIFGIDLEAESRAAREKVAASKTTTKQQIRALKTERDAAVSAHNSTATKQARQAIKMRKRALRRLASQA